ncbi:MULTISPECIES: precorrin-2 dehydrogenase/sirohydrochlorin ferrochelatase family protein [Maribacter]|uniref:precorrin-2 dehydrogenase n=2 Tax=Maribacter TaxID=252356 RepID=A0A5B2TQ39_9FLAO|nr:MULTISPECIES: bifunctional precorrin-2 dehydrogenase/sirohydrochlorin ferrochelatase [Maribacter]KAA2216596.1 bifunctional precorrin-2 dehydrogenase/sirohydrochlorin ferrochelatase [Maribacter flavus]MDC6406288.1 bifunctional precorrin-2 dehydrogenase/sirohydrochlorin ferrochelatase [Maribacter sp. PR66]MEE1973408.1 bifunctional precorrin-2 dehydrogenase/sirohydrochlorin ferrochelatase [Maribacter flavus]TLF44457.1 bifunctional precorrin-2 dehydrogenase/sirohydrochlorin ferrochelatase [Marib
MERNELYPIFLKVSNLKILIVGGGNVALEKLTFLLKSSPNAQVEMVSPMFREETVQLAQTAQVVMHKEYYDPSYLEGKHMVVATTDNVAVNEQVYHDCRERSILVNVADNPPFCDFYMGGIVTKGNVKVAISTNGKSPTTAKRLRQFFEDVIPENIDDLVKNLNEFRKTIKGDFEEKVETLNEFTKGLVEKKNK